MPAEERFDREGSRVSAAHGLDDRGKGRENIATVGDCANEEEFSERRPQATFRKSPLN